MKNYHPILVLVLASVFFCISCDKEDETEIVPAVVKTSPVNSISGISAVSGGVIESAGNGTILKKGICWSLSPDPTVENSFNLEGSGIESFESTMTELKTDSTYYVRAFAENEEGISYGDEISFKTLALASVITAEISNITGVGAVSGGEVLTDGGSLIASRGVCWGTSENPVLEDAFSSNGSGPGEFTSDIEGLENGTVYYVRAYATNAVGTGYGENVSFTTHSVPEVQTNAASYESGLKAVIEGEVISDGGTPVTLRGICWSTAQNPTISDSVSNDGNGIGNFSKMIGSLSYGTTYYVRAYAENNVGIAYGEQISFTTDEMIVGLWDRGDMILSFNDTTGVFSEILSTSSWYTILNEGLVSIGSAKVKNIVKVDDHTWNSIDLWWFESEGVYSVSWAYEGTITISEDGNSMTVTSSVISPNGEVFSGTVNLERISSKKGKALFSPGPVNKGL